MVRLGPVDPGFDPSGVYALELSLPTGRYPDNGRTLDFWHLAEARATETDGVTAAGLSGSIPPDKVFGLTSYVVRQRYREMGVRLALGAAPQSLTPLVVGRGMRYALGVSTFLSRWMGSPLFGVGAMDPVTTAGAVVV